MTRERMSERKRSRDRIPSTGRELSDAPENAVSHIPSSFADKHLDPNTPALRPCAAAGPEVRPTPEEPT
jgi:hypothetical protein